MNELNNKTGFFFDCADWMKKYKNRDKTEIFYLISKELDRQNELHGEENLEFKEDEDDYNDAAHYYKYINKNQPLLWSDILLEEVYEALSENEFEKQKEELIQVAATAIRIIESLERNKK